MTNVSYVPQYRIRDLTSSNNDYVHKSGSETITGRKTFAINNADSRNVITLYNYTLGQTDITKNLSGFNFKDSSGTQVGAIECDVSTAGKVSFKLYARNTDTSGTVHNGSLVISAEKDGTCSTLCPEPSANNNTSYTNIATTGWVNDPTKSLNVVHRTGDETIAGTKTFSSTINGTAMSALWADLAEIYSSDNNYEEGTLIEFGGNNEITIANKKVNGVISTKPALLMNKNEKGQPVALAGRVPVRVEGTIKRFDKLTLKGNGIARKKKWYEFFKRTIAISLEENNNEGIKKVLCVTKFNLD